MLDDDPRHLYVHIPFCRRRCTYCDFSIAVRPDVPVDRFVDALIRELRGRSAETRWSPITIYLGGGTPSRLGGTGVSTLVQRLLQQTGHAAAPEITMEANPEDVTVESAAAWLASGVNRISIGAQTFDDSALGWMRRAHTARDTTLAIDRLRTAGIRNLSLDLIFALPERLQRNWRDDLHRAIEIAPEHISLYGLTSEPATPLARSVSRGEEALAPDDTYASEFVLAHEVLTAAGYLHYEVSNYAKPGFQSRHNSAYWQGDPYAGLGPSAHSFNGSARFWNVSAFQAWLSQVESEETAIAGMEPLAEGAQAMERAYLGLRTSAGLPLEESQVSHAETLVRQGWGILTDRRLTLTTEGWLRLDSIAPAFAVPDTSSRFSLTPN